MNQPIVLPFQWGVIDEKLINILIEMKAVKGDLLYAYQLFYYMNVQGKIQTIIVGRKIYFIKNYILVTEKYLILSR